MIFRNGNSMKFKQYMVLGAGFAVLSPMSWAADAALQCTAVEDNALRLACYDKVYAAQLPPVKQSLFSTSLNLMLPRKTCTKPPNRIRR